jgi:hypothetical protein
MQHPVWDTAPCRKADALTRNSIKNRYFLWVPLAINLKGFHVSYPLHFKKLANLFQQIY